MDGFMRICPICGRQFEPTTWNNKYCSVRCVNARKYFGPMFRLVKYEQVEFKIYIEESQIIK